MAPSRILLTVGSEPPSGLSRAISSAWTTEASHVDLEDDEIIEGEGEEGVVEEVSESVLASSGC
jgi:hypothetical protein